MTAPRRIFLISLALAAAAFIFSSCKKQIATHPSWDASLLTPLLKSSLTLNDLLADSVLQTNADNTVSLVFSNKLYGASLTDLAVKVPDTTIRVGFSLETIN